jgi:predicted DNA-binding mobile mystery protein A
MKNAKQKLLIEQVDKKLSGFKPLDTIVVPKNGWVNTIRIALKMSLRQLGNRLHITSQSVKEIEQRESNETITLKTLREVGDALDLKLVYGFIPKNGSIEKMIEKKALELAKQIVFRTSHTMKLEDQENSKNRINKSIRNKAQEITDAMPKYLWD